MKSIQLRPSDVVIGVQLALTPMATIATLSGAVGRSAGDVSNAVHRLRTARLVHSAERRVFVAPLLAFIRWGVPFAFPVTIGGVGAGIPTARFPADAEFEGGADNADIVTGYVWPLATGRARGQILLPLVPSAPVIAAQNPQLRTALSLIDLVRIGAAREQDVACEALERMLGRSITPAQ
jgi:hypothetical protein